MAKKKKNPESTSANNGSSTIFETLFGDLAENQSSISIFSDQNPFRRKPNKQIHQPQPPPENQQIGLGLGLESPNFVQRKRKKDKKNTGLDSGSEDGMVETPLVIKKLKKGKSRNPDLSAQVEKLEMKNDEGAVKSLEGEQGNERNSEKKREKKRKRDEVEAEYEAQKYGKGENELGGKSVGEKRKKADEQLDMVPVAKEGFDDEAKLLRTVFVGNLPVKIKKKALLSEFRQFGDIESVRIRSVPLVDSKTPRKAAVIQKKFNDAVDSFHAYVVFKTEEAAQAALAHNMAVVGGNHIRVDRACPPRKKLKGENTPLYDNKRTVFVGNLPFDVKDEEIYQLFSGLKDLEPSSIEGIRVIRDPGSSLGKGIGYVLFKTRVDANVVARKRGLKLRDRELRISHAKSNLTPSKRKDSPSGGREDSRPKKLAADPANPDSNSKYKFSSAASYQGLRASKSGVEKKTSRPKGNEPVKFKSKGQSGKKVKDRSGKRPAVADRKAKAMKGGGDSASKQAGSKRKMGSRTPQSARGRPNKRAKN